MDRKSKLALARVAIFIFGFVLLSGLEKLAQPYVFSGYRFQRWSSEDLMQTVSIDDLRSAPIESLANIHVQPPGLDTIRTFLVLLWPSLDINSALRQVDLSLYFLWSILYGLMGVIIFQWLTGLIDVRIAFVASILFLFHPATILYATFLDATFITSFLLLWMYYSLWKVKSNPTSIFSVTLSSVLLFFFRTIFQLPFMLVTGASLYLLNVPWRKVGIFLTTTIVIGGLYMAKQYRQFGLITTSSLTGENLVASVGMTTYVMPFRIDLEGELDHSLPKVLRRKSKILGKTNFNNYHYLAYNQELINAYKEYMLTTPANVLLRSYYENLHIYFLPSSYNSDYNPNDNVIVKRLPWRSVYDFIFSWPLLNILLLVAAANWLAGAIKEKDYKSGLAMFLPALYVFLISVLFEKHEDNRYKFFLEPVFYIFIVSQFYGIINRARPYVLRRFATR